VTDHGDFSVHVTAGAAGEAVAVVAGEVDLATTPELEQALLDAARRWSRLVVDLTGCTFLSSTGLRALLEADGQRGEGSQRIVLVAPDPHIRKVFEIAGVDAIFELVDHYDEPGLDAGSSAAF